MEQCEQSGIAEFVRFARGVRRDYPALHTALCYPWSQGQKEGQVKRFKLPPNPAKMTDTRFEAYEREHGSDSWELDAIHPKELVRLVDSSVEKHVDMELFEQMQDEQETERGMLVNASNNWPKIEKMLSKKR